VSRNPLLHLVLLCDGRVQVASDIDMLGGLRYSGVSSPVPTPLRGPWRRLSMVQGACGLHGQPARVRPLAARLHDTHTWPVRKRVAAASAIAAIAGAGAGFGIGWAVHSGQQAPGPSGTDIIQTIVTCRTDVSTLQAAEDAYRTAHPRVDGRPGPVVTTDTLLQCRLPARPAYSLLKLRLR
jgi:hypothetical protein